MKKRILSGVLCLVMLLATGCGGAESSSAAVSTASSSTVQTPSPTPASEPKSEETTARPMDPATANQPVPTPEEPMTLENAEGIIALEANLNSATGHFNIIAVDAETGRQYTIATISAPSQESDDVLYDLGGSSYTASAREWLSTDYSKLAATRYDFYHGSKDAGWYDVDGVYTNVTELLGMQPQGDFDSPKDFRASGFSPDGYFVFYDNDDPMKLIFYSVPVNNLVPEAVETRNALADSIPEIDSKYAFNDWIDESRCLVDWYRLGDWPDKIESLIFDLTTGEAMKYVPGDGRYSWGGVASPDGSMVAFLSSPKEGKEQPALYTMPLAGGDPVRNPASFVFTPEANSYAPPFVVYPKPGTTCVTLLEWR